MITQHQNSNNPYFRVLIAVVVCSLAFVICLAISSCGSTKDMNKSSSTSVQTEKIDSTEFYKELYTSFRLKTEQEQSDMNSRLSFEQHNTDALLYEFNELQKLYWDKDLSFDSLNVRLRKIFDSIQRIPCKSTLKVDNKGNIEASGVKDFDLDLVLTKITTDLYKDSLSKERELRLQAEKASMQTSQVKTVVKKRGGFWWGFPAGFITCFLLIAGFVYWLNKKAMQAEKEGINH